MWVFCKHGGVSVTEAPSYADPELTDHGHRCIQVRGRDLMSLERIRREYAPDDASTIETTPERDYAYRFYVSRTGIGVMMAAMAMSIDYDNFKSAAEGPSYYMQLLNAIWSRWLDAANTGCYAGSRFGSFLQHLKPKRKRRRSD